jgi:hypothetical protein
VSGDRSEQTSDRTAVGFKLMAACSGSVAFRERGVTRGVADYCSGCRWRQSARFCQPRCSRPSSQSRPFRRLRQSCRRGLCVFQYTRVSCLLHLGGLANRRACAGLPVHARVDGRAGLRAVQSAARNDRASSDRATTLALVIAEAKSRKLIRTWQSERIAQARKFRLPR